jgi:hypothetical protein
MNVQAGIVLLFVLAGGLLAVGEEGSFDRSLSVSGPVDLDVKTDSGGITVRQGPAGSVKIHTVLKAEHGWFGLGNAEDRIRQLEQHPPIEPTGNRVRIGYVHEPDLLKGISKRLEIETPADTEVHAHADSGGIRVSNLHGPVDCKTDSGGIDVDDVSANAHLAADLGGIHARNINGSLYAHVDSGGIEANGISGTIDAEADSGSIRIAQTKAAPITAKADSGGVTVTLAHGAGYDVEAETGSGHISFPEMTVRSSLSQHHIEGKIGGGGPLVKVKVDSGSVTIQ